MQSDEFAKSKDDSDIPDIIRKSFRVPVSDPPNAWVVIEEQQYTVLDIGFDGIKIAVRDDKRFSREQSVTASELTIFDVTFYKLNGTVVHVSPNDQKEWECGIHWTDISEDTSRQIFEIVSKMKNKLLKDDAISFDSP